MFNINHFSYHILSEILVRVPVSGSNNCVCKTWNEVLTSKGFRIFYMGRRGISISPTAKDEDVKNLFFNIFKASSLQPDFIFNSVMTVKAFSWNSLSNEIPLKVKLLGNSIYVLTVEVCKKDNSSFYTATIAQQFIDEDSLSNQKQEKQEQKLVKAEITKEEFFNSNKAWFMGFDPSSCFPVMLDKKGNLNTIDLAAPSNEKEGSKFKDIEITPPRKFDPKFTIKNLGDVFRRFFIEYTKFADIDNGDLKSVYEVVTVDFKRDLRTKKVTAQWEIFCTIELDKERITAVAFRRKVDHELFVGTTNGNVYVVTPNGKWLAGKIENAVIKKIKAIDVKTFLIKYRLKSTLSLALLKIGHENAIEIVKLKLDALSESKEKWVRMVGGVVGIFSGTDFTRVYTKTEKTKVATLGYSIKHLLPYNKKEIYGFLEQIKGQKTICKFEKTNKSTNEKISKTEEKSNKLKEFFMGKRSKK